MENTMTPIRIVARSEFALQHRRFEFQKRSQLFIGPHNENAFHRRDARLQ
jgi:hypothetical protein